MSSVSLYGSHLLLYCYYYYSFYGDEGSSHPFMCRMEYFWWLCVLHSFFFFFLIFPSPHQLGPWRVDSVHRDVWRWHSDTRSDLQARNLPYVDNEGQRGRLSRDRPFSPQSSQLQLGPLCQMAHLWLGKSEKLLYLLCFCFVWKKFTFFPFATCDISARLT